MIAMTLSEKRKKMTQELKSYIETKKGALNQSIIKCLRACMIQGNKIYPFSYSGSGNYLNSKDYSYYVTKVFELSNISYSTGNDAPRGGKNGNFIEVNDEGIELFLSLVK